MAGFRNGPRGVLLQRLTELILMCGQLTGRSVLTPGSPQRLQPTGAIRLDIPLHGRTGDPQNLNSRLKPECSNQIAHSRRRTHAFGCDSRSPNTIRCSSSVNSMRSQAMPHLPVCSAKRQRPSRPQLSPKLNNRETSHSMPREVYFVSRSSNGPPESFNNGLRTILRRTFGMLNFRHFRLRVLDRFGKPQTQEST